MRPGARVEIPPTVRDVVRRRTERAGKAAAEVLGAASVLGGEFGFELLQRVTGMSEDRLLRHVETLLRARLLREREVSPGVSVLRFADEQIRAVLYEELSRLRRQRYHAKAAEALERAQGPNSRERAGELAHHFLEAGRTDRALDYLERAAERAAEVFARDEAIRHYRTALELLDGQPDSRRRLEILRRLGDQEMMLDHVEAAVRAWREAAEGFEKLADRKAAADLFGFIALRYRLYYDRPELAREALERARRLVADAPDSLEAARFHFNAARFYTLGEEVSEARRNAETALSIAERLEDRKTELNAHILLADLAPLSDREGVFQHLHRAREAVESLALNDDAAEVYGVLGIASLLLKGEAHDSIRWLNRGAEAARRVGDRSSEMTITRNLMASALVRLGDLAVARALMEEMFEYTSQRHPRPVPQLICTLGEVSVLMGDDRRAGEVLNLWLSYRTESVSPICRQRTNNVLARWHLAHGDRARAIEALGRARELYRIEGQPAIRAALAAETLALLVEASLGSRDEAGAYGALEELRSLSDALDVPVAWGYRYRSEGLWHASRGEVEAAATAFERGVEAWNRIDWRYELARTLFDLGSLAAQANEPGRALSRLREALSLFRAMDARPDADRALALVASLEARDGR
jgi:tetratricopeptide (TPR) repeat protein